MNKLKIKKSAQRFIRNIANMKNPHISDYANSSEEYGTIEDYSLYQEQSDLEKYKKFINSFAYDDIKETEVKISTLETGAKMGEKILEKSLVKNIQKK